MYAFSAAGNDAGQLKWKFRIGGGLTSTGILSNGVLFGGNVSVPGSIFALQLPDASPPLPPPPAVNPPDDGFAAQLLQMPVALALLIFAVAWLANLGGVLYYCRHKHIPPWPQPLISAFLLFVSTRPPTAPPHPSQSRSHPKPLPTASISRRTPALTLSHQVFCWLFLLRRVYHSPRFFCKSCDV